MTMLDLAPYLCGTLFAAYLLMMNRSGLHDGMSFFVLSAITLAFAGFHFARTFQPSVESVTARGMALAMIASAMNGIGGILLFYLIAKSGKNTVGFRLTAMTVTQAMMLGAVWPLVSGGLTPQRALGVLSGAMAIYLLR